VPSPRTTTSLGSAVSLHPRGEAFRRLQSPANPPPLGGGVFSFDSAASPQFGRAGRMPDTPDTSSRDLATIGWQATCWRARACSLARCFRVSSRRPGRPGHCAFRHHSDGPRMAITQAEMADRTRLVQSRSGGGDAGARQVGHAGAVNAPGGGRRGFRRSRGGRASAVVVRTSSARLSRSGELALGNMAGRRAAIQSMNART